MSFSSSKDRTYAYNKRRKDRMEEMLIKTRGKLALLIKEAKKLELYHLLTNEEMFGKPD